MARTQCVGQEQGPLPWAERHPRASEQMLEDSFLQLFPVSSRSLSPLGLSSLTAPCRAG